MKKLILTQLLISLSVLCYSQTKIISNDDFILDSILTKKTIYSFIDTALLEKMEYKYNSNYDIISKIKYGNIGEYHIYLVEWLDFEQTLYNYSGNDLIQEVRKEREDKYADMENYYQIDYTRSSYDSTKLYSFWENQEWRPTFRLTDSWTPDFSVITQTEERYNSASLSWEWDEKTDSIFGDDAMIDTIINYRWNDSTQWEFAYKINYDYSNYPDTIIYYNDWSSGWLTKLYFDSTLMCDMEIRYQFDTISMEPMDQRQWYYNEDGNIETYIRLNRFVHVNQWDTAHTINYYYNNTGQITEVESHSFMGNCNRSLYEYNSDNLISVEYYYPDLHGPPSFDKNEYYYTYKYLDIDQPESEIEPFFHPNPAISTIYISNSESKFSEFDIISLDGRIVKKGSLSQGNNILEVQYLRKGIYLINLYGINSHTSDKLIIR